MTGLQALGAAGIVLFIGLVGMAGWRINWKAIVNGLVDYRTSNINTLVFVCATYALMSLAVMGGMVFNAKITGLAAASSAVAAFIIVLATYQGLAHSQPQHRSAISFGGTAALAIPRRIRLSVFFIFLGLTVIVNSHVAGFLIWERFFPI